MRTTTPSFTPILAPADISAWLPVICPVCHKGAGALPAGRDAMAFACTCCGHYCLTCDAETLLSAIQPHDREPLSEAVQDTCLLADCDWPLIDGLTASALIALVQPRSSGRMAGSGQGASLR